jgi:hypothetical protein
VDTFLALDRILARPAVLAISSLVVRKASAILPGAKKPLSEY